MPTFDSLKTEELRKVAEAFGEETEGNKQTLVATLAEAGVTWEDYMQMFHPEVKKEVEVPEAVEVVQTNAVTSADLAGTDVAALQAQLALLQEELALAKQGAVVVRDEPDYASAPAQQYLIKMTRENPLFEIGGYRFTQEHPYNLVDASRAEEILSEEGFRQARPSEVQEYYG